MYHLKKVTRMQQRIMIVFVLILFLFSPLLPGQSEAQPQVTIKTNYEEHAIVIDGKPQEVILIARTSDQSVTFAWWLDGPGKLKGNPAHPGLLYVLTDSINRSSQKVTMTVTVTDEKGDTASASISFLLVLPESIPTPLRQAQDRLSQEENEWTESVTGMVFRRIPGGCFQMGCEPGSSECDGDEKLQHQVCVDGFWMGKNEVMNTQYRKFKRDHDSQSYEGHSLNDDNQPAVYVSWEDATAFVEWLTKEHGGKYTFRLPSEAEWEYAARAGTTTSRYWGDNPDDACRYANVRDETAKRVFGWDWNHNCDDGYAVTAPVGGDGKFLPNAFGLYDMLGNVWEWCQDVYVSDAYNKHVSQNPLVTSGGSDRVLHGGSWYDAPRYMRSANRLRSTPGYPSGRLGFRVVRTK